MFSVNDEKSERKQEKNISQLSNITYKLLTTFRYDECDSQILKTDFYDQNRSLDVNLKFLTPDDITEIQTLCLDFFPIEYPFSWYEEITSNTARFFSLAACNRFGKIIGLIVCEVKSMNKLNREDRKIISDSSSNYSLAYILSLGVHKK